MRRQRKLRRDKGLRRGAGLFRLSVFGSTNLTYFVLLVLETFTVESLAGDFA